MSGEIQAILFDSGVWTPSKARRWLAKHEYVPIKRVHKTENFLRYRLIAPRDNYTYRTKPVSDDILFVMGFPPNKK